MGECQRHPFPAGLRELCFSGHSFARLEFLKLKFFDRGGKWGGSERKLSPTELILKDLPRVCEVVMLDKNNQVTGRCTGVLLNSTDVLTAAHCPFAYDPGSGGRYSPRGERVRVDCFESTLPIVDRRITTYSSVLISRDYFLKGGEAYQKGIRRVLIDDLDIAVIRVKEPFPHGPYSQLVTSEEEEKTLIAGNRCVTPGLATGDPRIVTFDPVPRHQNGKELYANGDSLSGDSGGGIFCRNSEDQFIQVGMRVTVVGDLTMTHIKRHLPLLVPWEEARALSSDSPVLMEEFSF